MMVNVRLRDTVTGEIVQRNSVDAREMCAQADGRYEKAPDLNEAATIESDEPVQEPTTVVKPEGEALTEAICDVIGGLDETEDFNANSEPSLWALGHALGYSVTTDERTAAWTDYQIAEKEALKIAAREAAKNK